MTASTSEFTSTPTLPLTAHGSGTDTRASTGHFPLPTRSTAIRAIFINDDDGNDDDDGGDEDGDGGNDDNADEEEKEGEAEEFFHSTATTEPSERPANNKRDEWPAPAPALVEAGVLSGFPVMFIVAVAVVRALSTGWR
mmetsp:Transcript_18294/g.37597  ORF Transcript_18294/g.37597 Transcript_18294/m.37597 type:complete len:139 (+) Transcript_18294:337-753(+)